MGDPTRISGLTTGRSRYRPVGYPATCAGSEVGTNELAEAMCDEAVQPAADVGDATMRLFQTFTPARRPRKTSAVQFNESVHWPTRQRIDTVSTLQSWISQTPANLDVVAPIKARACDALQAVLRSKPRQGRLHSRLMPRGAERC